MPLFSPEFFGRRRDTSAGTSCRCAAHRARRLPTALTQPGVARNRGGIGPMSRSAPAPRGRTALPPRRTDVPGAVEVAPYPADDLPMGTHISRSASAALRGGEPDLIGGTEARVDLGYTRRVPADCPRPAGRLTWVDLPVHHLRRSRLPGPGLHRIPRPTADCRWPPDIPRGRSAPSIPDRAYEPHRSGGPGGRRVSPESPAGSGAPPDTPAHRGLPVAAA